MDIDNRIVTHIQYILHTVLTLLLVTVVIVSLDRRSFCDVGDK